MFPLWSERLGEPTVLPARLKPRLSCPPGAEAPRRLAYAVALLHLVRSARGERLALSPCWMASSSPVSPFGQSPDPAARARPAEAPLLLTEACQVQTRQPGTF